MKQFSGITFILLSLLCISGCFFSKLQKTEPQTEVAQSYLKPSSDLNDTLLLYKRTPCFGACPTFTMVVKMNGEVTYFGRQNVEMLGNYTAKWDANRLKQLDDQMQSVQFYQLPLSFDNPQVTDLPSTYIGYTEGNNLHTVKCRYQTPQNLKDLAAWLDGEIKQTTWNQNNSNNNHE
jgi:hypothetical protein